MTILIEAWVALLLGLIAWELLRASYKTPRPNSEVSVIVDLSASVVAVAVNGLRMGQAARKFSGGRKGATALSNVRWGRVLFATAVAHVMGIVLAAVAAVAAIAAGLSPDSALVAGLAGKAATWSVPALTGLAAAWVVRWVEPRWATLHGLLVGLLGAVLFGFHYYWPLSLPMLGMHGLIVAAGWLGSRIGSPAGRRG